MLYEERRDPNREKEPHVMRDQLSQTVNEFRKLRTKHNSIAQTKRTEQEIERANNYSD